MISIHNYLNVEKSIGIEEQKCWCNNNHPACCFSILLGTIISFLYYEFFFVFSGCICIYLKNKTSLYVSLSCRLYCFSFFCSSVKTKSHKFSLSFFFCVDCYSIFFVSLSISADLCAIYCIYIYKYEESKIHDDDEIEPKRRSSMNYLNSFFNYYIMCFSVNVFCVCVYMYANL